MLVAEATVSCYAVEEMLAVWTCEDWERGRRTLHAREARNEGGRDPQSIQPGEFEVVDDDSSSGVVVRRDMDLAYHMSNVIGA